MPFPIVPVAATAALAGLGFLIFGRKDEKKSAAPSPTKPVTKPTRTTTRTRKRTSRRRAGGGGALPGPSPRPGPSPLPGVGATATVTATSLNVRKAPNTSGAVITMLPRGTKVTIPEPNTILPPTAGAPQGWRKLQTSSGLTGFGSAEFLSLGGAAPGPSPRPGPAPAPTPKEEIVPVIPREQVAPPVPHVPGTAQAIVQATILNVRDRPDTSGKVLTTVPKGARVMVNPEQHLPATPGAPQGWFPVTANGKNGFASAQFLFFGSAKEASMTEAELQAKMLRESESLKGQRTTILGEPSVFGIGESGMRVEFGDSEDIGLGEKSEARTAWSITG